MNVSWRKLVAFSALGLLVLTGCSRDKTPPTVTATPVGGNYETAQQVALAANEEGATVHYTLDGSDPTKDSTAYAGPVEISQTTTLKFIGIDKKGNVSPVSTETYTITPPDTTPPNVTAAPAGGEYAEEQQVTLTADEPEATIYYTEDGTEPTDASTQATGPIAVSKTTTLKFFAKDAAGNASPVATEEYVFAAKKKGKK